MTVITYAASVITLLYLLHCIMVACVLNDHGCQQYLCIGYHSDRSVHSAAVLNCHCKEVVVADSQFCCCW